VDSLPLTGSPFFSCPGAIRAASPWAKVRRCYEAKQFTDTAHFTLRCGVCNIGVRGETEAREHAKSTGHTNFSEYS